MSSVLVDLDESIDDFLGNTEMFIYSQMQNRKTTKKVCIFQQGNQSHTYSAILSNSLLLTSGYLFWFSQIYLF